MSTRQRIYSVAGPRVQARLDRARYVTGALPRVAPEGGRAGPGWPAPHRACFVVSADLELAWAWRYANGAADPRRRALELARRSRENMPALLDTFRGHDVPVTWATVGHLFLASCSRNGRAHPEAERIPYFSNELWTYDSGDWFDDDPCSDLESSPEWYGPDLIEAIAAADTRHEIGCHTFSHVDFADDSCPPQVAHAEVALTVQAARGRGHEVTSMVFPGNRGGNLRALRDNGITSYRHHGRYHLDVPRRDELGLWQVPGGLCWEQPPGWRTGPWIAALRRCLDAAIESGTLLHLWFHPSCDAVNVEEVFPEVLEHLDAAGDAVWRATMREVVAWSAQQQPAER